jgi:hypothetical protein
MRHSTHIRVPHHLDTRNRHRLSPESQKDQKKKDKKKRGIQKKKEINATKDQKKKRENNAR